MITILVTSHDFFLKIPQRMSGSSLYISDVYKVSHFLDAVFSTQVSCYIT